MLSAPSCYCPLSRPVHRVDYPLHRSNAPATATASPRQPWILAKINGYLVTRPNAPVQGSALGGSGLVDRNLALINKLLDLPQITVVSGLVKLRVCRHPSALLPTSDRLD